MKPIVQIVNKLVEYFHVNPNSREWHEIGIGVLGKRYGIEWNTNDTLYVPLDGEPDIPFESRIETSFELDRQLVDSGIILHYDLAKKSGLEHKAITGVSKIQVYKLNVPDERYWVSSKSI